MGYVTIIFLLIGLNVFFAIVLVGKKANFFLCDNLDKGSPPYVMMESVTTTGVFFFCFVNIFSYSGKKIRWPTDCG